MILLIQAFVKGSKCLRTFVQKAVPQNSGIDREMLQSLAFKMSFEFNAEVLQGWFGVVDPLTTDSGVADLLLTAGVV